MNEFYYITPANQIYKTGGLGTFSTSSHWCKFKTKVRPGADLGLVERGGNMFQNFFTVKKFLQLNSSNKNILLHAFIQTRKIRLQHNNDPSLVKIKEGGSF